MSKKLYRLSVHGRFAVAVLMLLSFNFPGVPKPAHASGGTTYYVDSIGGNDINDGLSELTPWQSLTKLNEGAYQPGDEILLKSGSVWNGQYLAPSGSGTSGWPIVIDKYGGDIKPIINGNGGGITVEGNYQAVVSLYNQEYWEINNLEITNDDDFNVDANGNEHRRGISIIGEDYGAINHIYIRNCFIHDIDANNNDKDSGGIIGRLKGNAPMTYFNDILFESNRIEKIDRTGINFAYDADHDEDYSNRNNTNVVIRGNVLHDIGGDGIIVIGSNSPLVEYNVLSYCRNRTTESSVAIFPYQSTNAIIQFNEAYLTQVTDTHGDGQAFDSDYGTDGTIYQYNYSHDNEGGFMLLCSPGDANAAERSYNATIRYNISQNDGMRVFRLVGPGTRFSRIYNNTIYVGENIDGDIVQNEEWNGLAGETVFENNAFYVLNNSPNNPVNEWTGRQNARFYLSGAFKYDNNSYYGVSAPIYDINAVTADPMFVDAGGASIGMATADAYELQVGSSLIDAGKAINIDTGRMDFFGNAVDDGLPDIGALEYGAQPYDPILHPLPAPSVPEYRVSNYSFESGNLNAWTVNSEVSIDANNAHGGSYSARVEADGGHIEQTVANLLPETTYTLVLWAKVDDGEAPLTIGVHSYRDATLENGAPRDQKTVLATSAAFNQYLITFTTGASHTSVTVFADNENSAGIGSADGYVDLIRIAESMPEPGDHYERELVKNGGFETGDLTSWRGFGTYAIDDDPNNVHSGSYSIMVDGTGGSTGVEQEIFNLLPNTKYTLTVWGRTENGGDDFGIGVKSYDDNDMQVANDIESVTYVQKSVAFITGPNHTTAKIFVYKDTAGEGYVDEFSIVGPTDAYELVHNRGFESGGLSPWSVTGNSVIVNHDQRSGQYAGQVNGASGNGGIRQTIDNLLPNTTYSFGGWGKVANTGESMGIGVTDYGGAQIAYSVTSTDYANVSFTFTTGATNTSARIFVWKGTGGFGYIDDFTVIGPTSQT